MMADYELILALVGEVEGCLNVSGNGAKLFLSVLIDREAINFASWRLCEI